MKELYNNFAIDFLDANYWSVQLKMLFHWIQTKYTSDGLLGLVAWDFLLMSWLNNKFIAIWKVKNIQGVSVGKWNIIMTSSVSQYKRHKSANGFLFETFFFNTTKTISASTDILTIPPRQCDSKISNYFSKRIGRQ